MNTVKISSKGQITLPESLRKKLGLKEGDSLLIKEQDGSIILQSTIIMPITYYSDAQIKEWLADDELSSTERNKILNKVQKRKKTLKKAS